MLTPNRSMPVRLPEWGAVLGVVVAFIALFVANIPQQMTDTYLGSRWRGLGVLIGVAVYYLLWMVVRAVYLRLARAAEIKEFKKAA